MSTIESTQDTYESIDRVLDHAKDLLTGDRAREYGDPVESHEVLSEFWTTYLGYPVTPQDVSIMLCLLKVARLKNSPDHRDSAVDGVAYLSMVSAHQDVSEARRQAMDASIDRLDTAFDRMFAMDAELDYDGVDTDRTADESGLRKIADNVYEMKITARDRAERLRRLKRATGVDSDGDAG